MGYRFNVQNHLAGSVARYAEVRCWRAYTSRKMHSRKMQTQFFGLRSDVELAAWLLKALESFVWQKADEYSLRTGHADYFSKRDFAIGCVNRIAERLNLEANARRRRNDIRVSDGRSLIAVKEAMVEREFDKLGLDLVLADFARTYRAGSDPNAIFEGHTAGDKATFGRPVSGSEECPDSGPTTE